MPGIDINAVLQIVSILAIPVVFAITLHEVAHGWAANSSATTAYKLGRLSLNPLRHIDPIGTVVVPLGLAFMRRAVVLRLGETRSVESSNLRISGATWCSSRQPDRERTWSWRQAGRSHTSVRTAGCRSDRGCAR